MCRNSSDQSPSFPLDQPHVASHMATWFARSTGFRTAQLWVPSMRKPRNPVDLSQPPSAAKDANPTDTRGKPTAPEPEKPQQPQRHPRDGGWKTPQAGCNELWPTSHGPWGTQSIPDPILPSFHKKNKTKAAILGGPHPDFCGANIALESIRPPFGGGGSKF